MRKFIWIAAIVVVIAHSRSSSAGEEPTASPAVIPQAPSFDPTFDSNEFTPILLQDSNRAPVNSRFWGTAEYLMWWPKSGAAPAVLAGASPAPTSTLTTSPLPGTGFIGLYATGNTPGLFNPNFTSLAAGNPIQGLQSGGRFSLGYWVDPEQRFGIEAGYFFLGLGGNSSTASNGSPALGIPYIDGVTGLPTTYTVAQQPTTTQINQFVNTTPGVLVHLYDTTTTNSSAGNVAIHSGGNLQGYDANGIFNVFNGRMWRLDLLAGFRYAQLDEDLVISSSVTQSQTIATTFEPALGLPINGQSIIDSYNTVNNRIDTYATRNSFYGGQLGARSEFMFDRLSLFVGAQVGLGNMNEVVDINGLTNTTSTSSITPTKPLALAGIPLTVPSGAAVATSKTSSQTLGGFFAQPGNIGSYQRNVFAVMPQGDFKVAYRITDRITGTIGYTFVYMSSVVRPGDQVDHVINPNLLTSPSTTGTSSKSNYTMQTTDFWAQGVTFGLAVRY